MLMRENSAHRASQEKAMHTAGPLFGHLTVMNAFCWSYGLEIKQTGLSYPEGRFWFIVFLLVEPISPVQNCSSVPRSIFSKDRVANNAKSKLAWFCVIISGIPKQPIISALLLPISVVVEHSKTHKCKWRSACFLPESNLQNWWWTSSQFCLYFPGNLKEFFSRKNKASSLARWKSN